MGGDRFGSDHAGFQRRSHCANAGLRLQGGSFVVCSDGTFAINLDQITRIQVRLTVSVG